MEKIKLILVITLAFLLITPALADNVVISFSDTRLTKSDLEIDCLNETSGNYEYIGMWNTSSQGLQFTPPALCLIVVKPAGANPLTDPVGYMEGGFNYIQNNSYTLLFIILVVALLIGSISGRGKVRR